MTISASSAGATDEVEPNTLNMTVEIGKHSLPAINTDLVGKCVGDEFKIEAVAWHFAPPIVYDVKILAVAGGKTAHDDHRESGL
eukprot:CAMPEP_0204311290 /NCGR_PEP_ID=MMETSP0469-20131031/2250_1 /ASSEMBLY_ACC=CAM_ASM_000384 /TAXON_ID=2969 /ORGANISM="Oxyrrhis marina" /LENGTH=83 /DNA_ID=CAMNT_0051291219 /DNA_START=134 /DNA_END=385 /DNA_ORIENTATION=+